ncbi:MAG: bifunctional methylenetetrahydrofolate dehydrogenase/methenyltetrahydrofolate cyclohydrolase FolD [Lachnospirales bacterium]
MDKIISGTLLRNEILYSLKIEIEENNYSPTLAVVFVGDDTASKVYIKNKVKACDKVGISSIVINLDKDTSENELLKTIEDLNNDKDINGILVQLPLPKHMDEDKVIEAVHPLKDVDCFSSINVGKLHLDKPTFAPCTPLGIVNLLKKYNVDLSGKDVVVIGRSNIVGKPIAALLLKEDATVTICHSKTENLKDFTQKADVLIVALRKPKFIGKDYVKEGAVVVDVGIHRDENNKLCGDVDFDDVIDKVSKITPVPGGVGPMTIATLLQNCLLAYKIQNK